VIRPPTELGRWRLALLNLHCQDTGALQPPLPDAGVSDGLAISHMIPVITGFTTGAWNISLILPITASGRQESLPIAFRSGVRAGAADPRDSRGVRLVYYHRMDERFHQLVGTAPPRRRYAEPAGTFAISLREGSDILMS
jgi:hypothetical protein